MGRRRERERERRAYRNEGKDTHCPRIDTVSGVGHGADQHSQYVGMLMAILVDKPHTETIIGMEKEKGTDGGLAVRAHTARTTQRNRSTTHFSLRRVGGEVWAEKRAGCKSL